MPNSCRTLRKARALRFDLHSVSNDLRIRQEPQDLFIGIARDFCGIEFVERATIARSFFQNQGPVQSSLSA